MTPLLSASMVQYLIRPNLILSPLLVLSLVLPLIPLPAAPFIVLCRIIEIYLIVKIAWCLIGTINVVKELMRTHFQISKADNFRERRLLTQLQFIRKVAKVLIMFFPIYLVFMRFATVRKIENGLITSAGIASVIVGFVVQHSISNLLAGFQIAFTQPVRIDDVLVVEGE